MKKFSMIVLLMITLCLFLTQCNLPKRFVGGRIGYNHPKFCAIDQLPKTCTIQTEFFMVDFTISSGTEPGEYFITGGAKHQGASSFGQLVTGGEGTSKFYVLLAKDGVIIDSIIVMPRGKSLNLRLPFKKTFKCEPFDAAGFSYDIMISG